MLDQRAPIDVVGAAIVDDLRAPTRLLAARRSDYPAPLGWEFPGGKVEPGETWESALRREIREELVVDIVMGRWLPGPREDGRWPLGASYIMAVWLAQVAAGVPLVTDSHAHLRWLGRDELYDVPWLPGDLPIVRAVGELMR
jgi:8-oxo-dGTP diphosphatase